MSLFLIADREWMVVCLFFVCFSVHRAEKLHGDTSLMTYRGHGVLHTLIRSYFSPAMTTGQVSSRKRVDGRTNGTQRRRVRTDTQTDGRTDRRSEMWIWTTPCWMSFCPLRSSRDTYTRDVPLGASSVSALHPDFIVFDAWLKDTVRSIQDSADISTHPSLRTNPNPNPNPNPAPTETLNLTQGGDERVPRNLDWPAKRRWTFQDRSRHVFVLQPTLTSSADRRLA